MLPRIAPRQVRPTRPPFAAEGTTYESRAIVAVFHHVIASISLNM